MRDSLVGKSRRRFLKGLLALPVAARLSRLSLWASARPARNALLTQIAQPEPGRIENVYVKFL
ncbi:MAG: hypothetical protein ACLGXA_18550, partial [Acidobacteriota bacterium]